MRMTVYFQNNVESTFFDNIRQPFAFCFQLHKVPNYSKKINAMMCPLILLSLIAAFHYPGTIIPLFQLGRSP
jgi:hypothetical protein